MIAASNLSFSSVLRSEPHSQTFPPLFLVLVNSSFSKKQLLSINIARVNNFRATF